MSSKKQLPEFVKPMLARPGTPFDSEQHLFEIKWDGIRATAYVEQGKCRLLSRRGNDMTARYPELESLARLPAGTVLDGELVVLDSQGCPDFRAVLRREQARSPLRYRTLAQKLPANFIVFDQIYHDYDSLVTEPLSRRREWLLGTIERYDNDRVVASDGVIGPGKQFFQSVTDRELEGVVAKRLDSRYFPGKRTDAWTKIRKSHSLLCAIIGFVPKGDDFESLILATDNEGDLNCVGRVGTGFDTTLREQLNALLRDRVRRKPLIRCGEKGTWIEPGLYCSVRFLERTPSGVLREPVFERLVTEST